jgi:nucleoside-diphosphate-sugar epimerase
MRVLITGASSLIGAGVARSIAERGDEVVCFQRTPSARVAHPAVTEHLGDVRDVDALLAAAQGADAIVHVAAKVGVVGAWEDYRSVNVDGTANVVSVARNLGITRLVHVSSPSVAHGGEPIIGAGADRSVLGRDRAWYAESKALAERMALAAASDDLGVVAIRPHLVWGPGDTQLVGRIVERARTGRLALVGGGRALVDTTYIDNAVSALVAALDAVAPTAACSGRPYVVANGEPRMIRELVAGICAAAAVPFAPRDVPLRIGTSVGSLVERVWPLLRRTDEPPITRFLAEQLGTAHWFDPRPARDDLGWTPTVTIDDGLARLAGWYAAQRPT